MTRQNNAILQDRLDTLVALLKKGNSPFQETQSRVESEWSSWRFERLYVRVVDTDGHVLVESPRITEEITQEVFLRSTVFESNDQKEYGSTFKTNSNHFYMGVAKRLEISVPKESNVLIFLALDLDDEHQLLNHYRFQLIWVLGITLILSAIIGRSLSSAGFKPVEKMIECTKKVHSMTLYERLEVDNLPVELKVLASTVNEMLNRLEESFDRLTRFSSDIAHELRTPVNNLRGEIEVTLGKVRSLEEYQDNLHSALEEVNRISRVIDSLLFLAQAENPNIQIKKEKINLYSELGKIIEFYEPTVSEEGLELKLTCPENIFLSVEKTLFQRAIGNLLSNAINYTPRGGVICIEAFQENHETQILVKDTGVGISEGNLPRVFDRFYREDDSRTTNKLGGFGLGLPIVKGIVKLHGGVVELESKKNQGTTAKIRIPNGTS